jgi:LmbE family N-acetylglucosaminyl deacetylase
VVAYPVWAWARGPWFLDVPMPTRLSLLAWAGRQMVFGNPSVSVSTAGYLDAKRAALCAHASQTTNLTGEPTWQYLHPDFCALFLRKAEIFIHVD